MGVFSLISNSANLRQSLMPVKLKPGGINEHYENSTAVGSAPPQFFSFKESKRDEGTGGFGLLNICPSSFKQFMSSDIGYKLLYNYTKNNGITKDSITANAVFDNLPSLQIREYAIDSELDQLVNLFRDLVNVFNPGDKNAPNNSVKKDSTKGNSTEGAAVSESKNIAEKIKGIWEKLAEKLKDPGWYDTIYGSAVTAYTKNITAPDKEKVVRFPFAVYYRLLSCVTTNCYEVPIHPDFIIQSKSEGFEADQYKVEFPGQGAIGSIPIIGKVITRLMSTIAINTSPVWDPSKTTNNGPTVTCKFKLFNDTVQAAVNNFIFTQTIAANNMWYNYSIFKRAPALYDIKVNGVCRWFMCTADVMIKPAGPMRKVPKHIISKIFSSASEDTKNYKMKQNIDQELEDQEKTDKEKEKLDEQLNQKQQELAELHKQQDAIDENANNLDPDDPNYAQKTEEAQQEYNNLDSQINAKNKEIEALNKQKQKLQDEHNKKVQDHINDENSTNSNMTAAAVENEYIAIPDIYDVELSFTSQLPNNFNNFLYNYAGNPDIMRSDKGYQSNIVKEFVNALKQLVDL